MYDAEVTIKGEKAATADQFIAQVNQVNRDLNKSWSNIKSNLPSGEQVAAEDKVRTVLKA